MPPLGSTFCRGANPCRLLILCLYPPFFCIWEESRPASPSSTEKRRPFVILYDTPPRGASRYVGVETEAIPTTEISFPHHFLKPYKTISLMMASEAHRGVGSGCVISVQNVISHLRRNRYLEETFMFSYRPSCVLDVNDIDLEIKGGTHAITIETSQT